MIYSVKQLLESEDYVEVTVTCGGTAFDVAIEGGVVDKGDLRIMPPEVAAAFLEAWPRYRAAKAVRSVTVSRATMRPMDDPALGEDERLFAMPDGTLGMGEAREINADAALPPVGWWPVPDLTPMPAEFEGWDA